MGYSEFPISYSKLEGRQLHASSTNRLLFDVRRPHEHVLILIYRVLKILVPPLCTFKSLTGDNAALRDSDSPRLPSADLRTFSAQFALLKTVRYQPFGACEPSIPSCLNTSSLSPMVIARAD